MAELAVLRCDWMIIVLIRLGRTGGMNVGMIGVCFGIDG